MQKLNINNKLARESVAEIFSIIQNRGRTNMKNFIVFIISIFFSVQVFAQSEDSQDVTPTEQTTKTSLAGEYIYADSYFRKSKTGVLLKWLPATGPTVFYGWRFVVYNTEKELDDIFLTLPIDVRIIGEEYKDKDFTAKKICYKRKIEIIYNKRDHSFSSTDLKKRTKIMEIK